MTDEHAPAAWLRPLEPRDPSEKHRQASFLELFFDLCFVVAVAQAAAAFHHSLAEAHVGEGVVSYFTVFFAIWWAWMNFTWFCSAYDNDDVPFRIATMVQIAGALVLAAGVKRGFEAHDFDIIFLGYAIMRAGLVSLWLRAAWNDPARRRTNIRYAIGISVVMLGWMLMLIAGQWPLWGWWLMAMLEMAVPVWAERGGNTSWHPRHIAERYGLFTIIVLGESVLAATIAVQSALSEQGATSGLLLLAGGGLLTLFSMWWLYFAKPAHSFLTSNRAAFPWGYGHYFIFTSAAAVGAGLAVNIEYLTGHSALGDRAAGAVVTISVAVYLAVLWALQIRPHRAGAGVGTVFAAAVFATLAATLTPWPVPVTGVVMVATVAVLMHLAGRRRDEVVAE